VPAAITSLDIKADGLLHIALHQEKFHTRNYSTKPCDSLSPRERYSLLLQTISMSFYIPCCYCPSLSVHPVVTVHFPLSLNTLLLLCTSPYLCTPCCYCALPPISVHPVVTVHFPLSLYTLLLLSTSPYLCTPCCYSTLPPIFLHPAVTVHFPLSLYTL